jgi:RNA polymerase sigma-70 factor (ECF subfamily)
MIDVAALPYSMALGLVPGQARAQEWLALMRSGVREVLVSVEQTPVESDLETLLERIATHRDEPAFAALFDRTAPRVKGLMMRLGMDAATADELAQETMLRVWQKSALFDSGKASATTWIFAIARNLRIDRIRRDSRPEPDPNDPTFLPPPELSAEEHVDARKRQEAVRASLADLPDDQRQAVHLSFVEGLSHQEIAERLHIPLGTVKSRLRLSFDKLRTMLRNL